MNESYFVIRHSPVWFSVSLEWLFFLSPLLVLAESKYCSGRNGSESLLLLSSSGIPPHCNHSLYGKEAQNPTPTYFFFSSKHFVFCVHFHSIHNENNNKKKATSFVLIFLFLYNFMVIKFNLMWKNEDRETGLPAYLFQQKTRTRQFPVKIQAERVGKRKRPSVCGPTPEGRDYMGSRACWGWVLTTGPGLPPTSPKDTENGLSIRNWQ